MYPVIASLSATNPQDNGIGSRLGCWETRPEVAVHPAFGVRFPAEIALTIGHIVPFSVGTNRSVASVLKRDDRQYGVFHPCLGHK